MASETDICNLALVRIGSLPITSMDDGSKRSTALNSIFEMVRDMVLRDHPWNFAVQRATLAQLTEAPAFGYTYAYQLPVDCLRVLGMVGDEDNLDPSLTYKLEGGHLLTDEDSAQIKYIRRVTEVGLYDAGFVSALASRLAAEVAYNLTASAALKEQMMKEYLHERGTAASTDAQEDTPEVYETNSWIDARE